MTLLHCFSSWFLTNDGEFLVTGNRDGFVRFIFLKNLKIFRKFSFGKSITSLILNFDEKFIVGGLCDGHLLIGNLKNPVLN
ncbi:beach domain-containing protein lvsc [Anaeramoeba ignava]|uniref:Beach domain-containing protein lvsc n=1 Tax=Anaeramoeba ignava TaxID=1746090 RepID=A0A9Q0RC43_ANAIG|nr:beach domain-containing protein lvsc [Anaeramoeba ignava]